MGQVVGQNNQREDDKTHMNAYGRVSRAPTQMGPAGEEEHAPGRYDHNRHDADQHGADLLTRVESPLLGHLSAKNSATYSQWLIRSTGIQRYRFFISTLSVMIRVCSELWGRGRVRPS